MSDAGTLDIPRDSEDRPGDRVPDDTQSVGARAAAFQALTEECVRDKTSLEDLLERLRAAKATHDEAAEYIGQAQARLREQPLPPPPHTPQRKATPEGLSQLQIEEYRQKREEARANARLQEKDAHITAVEAAGWAILREKVRSHRAMGSRALEVDDPFRTAPDQTASISAALVADVPHLATYFGGTGDTHLDKTYHLRQHYSVDKVLDILITQMQSHPITTHLPRPVWRRIIQDRYIPFKKLFAAIESAKDADDEHHVVIGNVTITDSDQFSAKKPVTTEAEWSRLYSAWEAAFIRVYPHRKTELTNYRELVSNHFRAKGDPSFAIRFNAAVRDAYSKSPFKLDDRANHDIPLLASLYEAAAPSTSKRASTSTASASKRGKVVCDHWNFGNCADPCANSQRHGICSECGDHHRARDFSSCFSILQARKRRGGPASGGSGSGGGERPKVAPPQ
jgi:hypothetical protein